MAGFVGTTWVNSRGLRVRSKFNWDKGQLSALVGAGAAVALQKAGLEVRRSTQRMMVGGSTRSGRVPLKRPRWWKVGEKDGYPVLAFVKKVPRPDKVSSWAPRAYLRNDVQSDYDPRTQSVIIGPSKFPWLNQLHEFGGSVSVYVQHGKTPVREFEGIAVPKKHQRMTRGKNGQRYYVGAYVGTFNNNYGAFHVGTRTVRDRKYMETGLQASLHKIPSFFSGTLTVGNGTIRVRGEKRMRS